jgi:hypothetical protein
MNPASRGLPSQYGQRILNLKASKRASARWNLPPSIRKWGRLEILIRFIGKLKIQARIREVNVGKADLYRLSWHSLPSESTLTVASI